MEIRAAGYREPVPGRQLPIPSLSCGVVIAVPGFDSVKPRRRKPRNQMIHGREPRMRHRCDAPSLADDCDDGFRRWPTSWDKCWLSNPQQPLECVVAISYVAGVDQRICNLGPTD